VKNLRQRLGSWGEDLAADFLQKQGFEILARNLRTPHGEIDLVARKKAGDISEPVRQNAQALLTVFVEVKARSGTEFGYPEQAVTAAKRLHLLAAAQEYILQHPETGGEWRVDVIAILRPRDGSAPQIRVFENAITAEG
jgi:putative endonuclease